MAMNMASQNMLPMPVQLAAMAHQLGAFSKVYPATIVKTIIGALVFLVIGIGFAAAGILPQDTSGATKVVFLIFALLFVFTALYMMYGAIRVANQQVYLFQEGLVITKGEQVQPFPWTQANEVTQSITRNYRNGVYTGTTYLFTLRRADGYELKLDNLTKGIAELGPAVAQGITRALVPRALQSLQMGQTLPFNPFSINQQTISNGKATIPWTQVQSVDVKQGQVTVRQIGNKRVWGSAMVAKIPNFLVFTVVADEMLRRSRGR